MPAVRVVMVGDNEVPDTTSQMNWIQTLVDRINARASDPTATADNALTEEDDLPDEFYQ